MSLSPAEATVAAGETQQFSASVSGSSNTVVTWTVNGIPGGDETTGTISTTGLYRAPASLPNPNPVTLVATSNADPTKSASAIVTVIPRLATLEPLVAVASSGDFNLIVRGLGFTPNSKVEFGAAPRVTVFEDSSRLVARIFAEDIASSGRVPVRVRDGNLASRDELFSVVPQLRAGQVTAVGGAETEGLDVDVTPAAPTSLTLLAAGVGTAAGNTGIRLQPGEAVRVLLVGHGLLPGIYVSISGPQADFAITQPVAADFTTTTDGTPAVRVSLSVSPTASAGVRNILVANVEGERAVFAGGIEVGP